MHWKHLFEEVSKLPEFAKAARRRAHNSQLSRAGITKKQAKIIVCSSLSAKDASAEFGVKVHTVRRLRQNKCWSWLRKSVNDKIATYRVGKLRPTIAQKIFKATGSTASIAETFNVSITCVQKIKARITFTEATEGLKRGKA
jgi:transposase